MVAPAKKVKPQKPTAIEELLGSSLLTAKDTAKPTKEVLKGKELVALFFSGAWCESCQKFTPVLTDFYNEHAQTAKLEVIYMSSDGDETEFNGYFEKMPWLALPIDRESGKVKANLAKILKLRGIPVLVVLDAKTGHLVSDQACMEVEQAMESKELSKVLLTKWKATKPLPFSEAVLTGGRPPMGIRSMIWSVLKNPIFLVGLVFVLKTLRNRAADSAKTLEGGEQEL